MVRLTFSNPRIGLTYLISGEEEQGIIVVCECVNRSENALQIHIVVRGSRLVSVDGVVWRIDIQREIDPSIRKHGHASIVVLAVVDGIDTHSVDSQLLEVLHISLASLDVCQWVCTVCCIRRTAGLIVDALDVESLIASEESCG
jgi:hypothetical protein